jgi:hypothetical protein
MLYLVLLFPRTVVFCLRTGDLTAPEASPPLPHEQGQQKVALVMALERLEVMTLRLEFDELSSTVT